MCIAIYKPAGKIISETKLHNCMSNNDDGAGFAIVEKDEKGKNELNVYKGYFEFADFWKAWSPHQDKQALLHFRIATHKLVDGENCHPFRINSKLVLIHNGTFRNLPDDDKISDTGVFCEKIIKPFAKQAPDFWLSPQFKWMINNSITTGNKVVMMDVQGRHMIFNEDQGNWCDGVWYSNYGYNFDRRNWAMREYWGHLQGCGMRDGDVIDTEAEDMQRTSTLPDEPIDNTIRTSDVDEIDRMLEKFQKRTPSLG